MLITCLSIIFYKKRILFINITLFSAFLRNKFIFYVLLPSPSKSATMRNETVIPMTDSSNLSELADYDSTTVLVAMRSVYAPLDDRAINALGYSGSFMIPLPLFGGDRDNFNPMVETPLSIGGGITIVRGAAMQDAMERVSQRQQELREHPENGIIFCPIVGYKNPLEGYFGIPRNVPHFLNAPYANQIVAIETPGRLLSAQGDGLSGLVRRMQTDFPDCITRVYPVEGQPLHPVTFSIPSPMAAQELMGRLREEPQRYRTL